MLDPETPQTPAAPPPTQTTDPAALAKKYGATSVEPVGSGGAAATTPSADAQALAKKYGATSVEPEESSPMRDAALAGIHAPVGDLTAPQTFPEHRPWYEAPPPGADVHPSGRPPIPPFVQSVLAAGKTTRYSGPLPTPDAGDVGMMAGMIAAPEVAGPAEGAAILTRLAARMALSAGGAAAGQQVGETAAGTPVAGAGERMTSAAKMGAAGEALGEVAPIAKAVKARSVTMGEMAGTPPVSVGAVAKEALQRRIAGVVNKVAGPPKVYAGLEGTPPVDVGEALKGTGTTGMARSSGPLTTLEGWLRSNLGGNQITRAVNRGWQTVRGALADVASATGRAGTAREAGQTLLAPERARIGQTLADETASAHLNEGGQFDLRQTEADAAAADAEAKTAAAAGDATAATAARERATTLRQQITDHVGPPMTQEAAGVIHTNAHAVAEQAADDAVDEAFAAVDKQSGGASVSPDRLLAAAQGVKSKAGKLVQAITPGQATLVKQTVQATKAPVPEAVQQMQAQGYAPDLIRSVMGELGVDMDAAETQPLTFMQAHRARSRFGQIYWRNKDTNPGLANAAATLKHAIDADMTAAAGGADSPLRQTYDAALALHQATEQTYKEGVLADLAKKNPKQAVQFLLSTPSADQLREIWTHVGPEAQSAVRQAALDSILHDATGAPRTGKALATKLAGLTPDTRDVVFGPEVGSQLHALAPLTAGAETAEETAAASETAAAKARATALTAAGRLQSAGQKYRSALTTATTKAQTAEAGLDPISQFQSLITPSTDVAKLTKTKADVGQLLGPDAWSQVQARWTHDLLDPENEKSLQDRLAKLRPEVVREMIPDTAMRNTVYRYARVIDHFQKATPNISPWVLRGHIASALGMALLRIPGGLSGMAAEQGISAILSRVLMDPHAGSALVSGLRAASLGDQPAAAKLALEVARFLKREGIAGPQSPSGPPRVGMPPRAVEAGPGGPPPTVH